jgi:ABC-type transport system substrate-binding protein
MNRRRFLTLAAIAAGSIGVVACGGPPATTAAPTTAPAAPAPTTAPAAPAPTTAPAAPTTAPAAAKPTAAPTAAAAAAPTTAPAAAPTTAPAAAAVTLPSDAAPLEQQIRIGVTNSAGAKFESMDFQEGVYNRAGGADLFNEPLVRLTKDFQIVPGVASKWGVSDDGKTWTFQLDKGLMWSDGNEVTADDYVETFRWTADPKHAWDFTWYWSGVIKNYTEATKGSVPTNQIGVRTGADKYQLLFETESPVPYLPAQLLYSWTLSKVGLMKTGSGKYNLNPATSITSGPYMLAEWAPDRRFVVKANPKYTGKLKPLLQQLVYNVVSGGDDFQRYQANEIDTVEVQGAANLKLVLGDATLQKQFYKNPQDFRTFYLFFDVNTAPWDKLAVRQAFSHAVDRDAIIKAILAPMALPAYSFLMPGFPDANSDGLKDIQSYNPDMAKKLLADAGYPGGKGFPQVTLFVRGGGPVTDPQVTQAIVANFNQVLGVNVQLQTQDSPTFMAALNAKPTKIPFGWISYGMDYFDATNMLGVFKSGGRHSWKNDDFDKTLVTGGSLTGDPAKRTQMMQAAEKILVSDVVGIFVYHWLHGYLFKPFIKGDVLTPNKFGFDGEQWPGFGTATLAIPSEYNTTDVSKFHKS